MRSYRGTSTSPSPITASASVMYTVLSSELNVIPMGRTSPSATTLRSSDSGWNLYTRQGSTGLRRNPSSKPRHGSVNQSSFGSK